MRTRFLAALLGALCLASAAMAQTSVGIGTVTPNAAAYVAGNCLGGVVVVAGAVSPQGDGGTVLASLVVVDPTGQDAPIDFLFFAAAPTGTYTDHAACALAAADAPNFIGSVSVSGYKLYGTAGVATAAAVGLPLNTSAGGQPIGNKLWVVPVVQGTPTYGAAQTLYFRFGVIVDAPAW